MLMRKLYGKKASNPHFLSKEKDIKIEEMHSPKDSASNCKGTGGSALTT